MPIVVTGAAVAMASVLLWAGLQKARNVAVVASIMARVGIPEPVARPAAALLVTLEVAVGLGLVFRPGSAATIAGVVGLAAAFAIAGAVAVWRNERIHCRCFGPYDDGVLGLRQVAAFPLWLGAAALLWLSARDQPSEPGSALMFAVGGLAMAALRAIGAVRESQVARGDRLSAQEMHAWLPR